MSTMARHRAWQGPALFSFGFRPFFLGAGLWAAMSMVLWIAMISGFLSVPTRFTLVDWHAHAAHAGIFFIAVQG